MAPPAACYGAPHHIMACYGSHGRLEELRRPGERVRFGGGWCDVLQPGGEVDPATGERVQQLLPCWGSEAIQPAAAGTALERRGTTPGKLYCEALIIGEMALTVTLRMSRIDGAHMPDVFHMLGVAVAPPAPAFSLVSYQEYHMFSSST